MYGMLTGLAAAARASAEAAQAQAEARRGRTTAAETQRELALLMERLDKLILINMGVWSLLQERTGLTEEQLVERVEQIDMRDGVPDGKVTRTLQKCARCGRTISRRRRRCLFCGGTDLRDTVFDAV